MTLAQTAPTPPVPPVPPVPAEPPGLFQTPAPPIPDFLFWNEIVIPLVGMLITGILVVVVGLPIVKALVRRLEGKSAAAGAEEVAALRAELMDLRQRVERMEDGGQRVAELEERMDFAERMLAQQRQARPLGSGG